MGFGNSSYGGAGSQGLDSIGTGANAHNSKHGKNNVGKMDAHEAGVRGGWKNAAGTPSNYDSGQGEGHYASQTTWNPFDGWHEVSTRPGKENDFGGYMATPFGFRNPQAYAREKTAFNVAQRNDRLNREYQARQGFMDANLPEVNPLDVGTVRGIRQGIADAVNYGDLETLRDKYEFDTTSLATAHEPAGFMDSLLGLFGGEPDKVETQPGLMREYSQKGLVEYDDYGNPQLTNKGKFVGVSGPLSNFAPGVGGLVAGLGGQILGQVATGGLQVAAAQNPNNYGVKGAGALKKGAMLAQDPQAYTMAAGFSPVGGMVDTYQYARDLERIGLAPGGQSLFDMAFDGKVNGLNEDVYTSMLGRAEQLATPSDYSEYAQGNMISANPTYWQDPQAYLFPQYQPELTWEQWRSSF